jgi:hypothetical protein
MWEEEDSTELSSGCCAKWKTAQKLRVTAVGRERLHRNFERRLSVTVDHKTLVVYLSPFTYSLSYDILINLWS